MILAPLLAPDISKATGPWEKAGSASLGSQALAIGSPLHRELPAGRHGNRTAATSSAPAVTGLGLLHGAAGLRRGQGYGDTGG